MLVPNRNYPPNAFLDIVMGLFDVLDALEFIIWFVELLLTLLL